MLDTAKNTYDTFLDGIKKSYTGTVTPMVFNRLINDWGIDEWLKANVSEEEGVDLTTKQRDDLQLLKVITDGVMVYNGDVMYDMIPDVAGNYVFTKPDGITSIHNVSTPATTHNQVYPKYMRLSSIMFKLNYVNNTCGFTGVSEYMKAQIMKSSERAAIYDNYYLKPEDENLYYEFINNKIKLITGTASTPYSMQLEYLRYPKSFYFDPNRKIKSCLTIDTNGLGVGTINFTLTTTLAAYSLIAAVAVTLNESKYVIAKAIYDAIQNDAALPTSIKNYTTLSENTVCIGQYGYNVTSLTLNTTGTVPTTTITIGATVSDVNIELPEQQRKEVVEQAVRIYLERVTDVRYKSYLTEEAIREQGKK
jgi:hypothetical protein